MEELAILADRRDPLVGRAYRLVEPLTVFYLAGCPQLVGPPLDRDAGPGHVLEIGLDVEGILRPHLENGADDQKAHYAQKEDRGCVSFHGSILLS